MSRGARAQPSRGADMGGTDPKAPAGEASGGAGGQSAGGEAARGPAASSRLPSGGVLGSAGAARVRGGEVPGLRLSRRRGALGSVLSGGRESQEARGNGGDPCCSSAGWQKWSSSFGAREKKRRRGQERPQTRQGTTPIWQEGIPRRGRVGELPDPGPVGASGCPGSCRTLCHPSFQPVYSAILGCSRCSQHPRPEGPAWEAGPLPFLDCSSFFYTDPTQPPGCRIYNWLSCSSLEVLHRLHLDTPAPIMAARETPPAPGLCTRRRWVSSEELQAVSALLELPAATPAERGAEQGGP